MNRKVPFVIGEYYHCYNRGVEKREIFLDAQDFDYYLKAIELFNREESLGGMMEYQYPKNVRMISSGKELPLVNIHAYCLNPNHFHFVLRQNVEDGIQKFMQKVNTGYAMYFNKKYERSGTLFQGKYKSIHISSDEYLRHVLVYVSFNNKVHSGITNTQFRSNLTSGGKYKKTYDSSLIEELFGTEEKFKIVAKERLPVIRERRELVKNDKDNIYLE